MSCRNRAGVRSWVLKVNLVPYKGNVSQYTIERISGFIGLLRKYLFLLIFLSVLAPLRRCDPLRLCAVPARIHFDARFVLHNAARRYMRAQQPRRFVTFDAETVPRLGLNLDGVTTA